MADDIQQLYERIHDLQAQSVAQSAIITALFRLLQQKQVFNVQEQQAATDAVLQYLEERQAGSPIEQHPLHARARFYVEAYLPKIQPRDPK